jgi:Fe2+ or Zn2+ uptake regulation protein
MTQRHTRQRQRILRAIKSSTRPVTADAVRAATGSAKTTLYRNLEWLAKRGEIAVADADDGVKRYVGHSSHEATFTCQRCGKTRTLTSRTLNDYVQRKMFGPQTVMTSRLSASGLCTDCTERLKRP